MPSNRHQKQCINGEKCQKIDCKYLHPKSKYLKNEANHKNNCLTKSNGPPPCKFGDECRNKDSCMFFHKGFTQQIIKCKFGSNCRRENCFYTHPHQIKKSNSINKKSLISKEQFNDKIKQFEGHSHKYFLMPKKSTLKRVPNVFKSKNHWLEILIENMFAEYFYFFQTVIKPNVKNAKVFKMKHCEDGFNQSKFSFSLGKVEFPENGVTYQLVSLNSKFYVVLNYDEDKNYIILRPKQNGKISSRVEFRFLGYIGTYYSNYKYAKDLYSDSTESNLLTCILNPNIKLKGSQLKFSENNCALSKSSSISFCNPNQQSAVNKLSDCLEIIHGPPGTGKSTTISAIIRQRVPENCYVLVTASRNKALDSIVEKLKDLKIVVFGNNNKVGANSFHYLLSTQIERDEKIVEIRKQISDMKKKIQRKSLKKQLYIEYKENIEKLNNNLNAHISMLKKTICEKSRVFLCTIASIGKMKESILNASITNIHTTILDEAASVEEIAVTVIFSVCKTNLVLIGDHKQLPPLTLMQDKDSSDLKYNRSLMERLIDVSGKKLHMLNIQYRMHPCIQNLVSKLYYDDKLLTSNTIVRNRTQPLIQIESEETEEERDLSIQNKKEANTCLDIYNKERKICLDQNIMIITFYTAQLSYIKKKFNAFAEDKNLRILTVDAAQGSEADIVIISCVRSNNLSHPIIGFLSDKRRINVAISRARECLYFVGNSKTFISSENRDQIQIVSSCVKLSNKEL